METSDDYCACPRAPARDQYGECCRRRGHVMIGTLAGPSCSQQMDNGQSMKMKSVEGVFVGKMAASQHDDNGRSQCGLS